MGISRKNKIAFLLLVLFGVVAVGLVFVFQDKISVLSPQGMIGEKQKDLLVFATFLLMAVVIPALVLPFWIVWKYHAANKKAKYSPEWDYNWILEAVWWGIPFVIILILGIITWRSCHDLDPFRPIVSEKQPMRIQVVALQWKWLFLYPDQGIATVNFIQFPEQTPINFEITSDAPMNSFWIPELGGQVYAMAGMRSKLHLIASKEGIYRGLSANFSGKGFAGMQFFAKSSNEEEFHNWVESVRSNAAILGQEEYRQLVLPSEYDPAVSYRLENIGLFDQIMMQYMTPTASMQSTIQENEHDLPGN